MLFKSFYKWPPDTSCLTIPSSVCQRFKIPLLLPPKKAMNGDGVCPGISKWIGQSASILKSTWGQKVVSHGGTTSTDFGSSPAAASSSVVWHLDPATLRNGGAAGEKSHKTGGKKNSLYHRGSAMTLEVKCLQMSGKELYTSSPRRRDGRIYAAASGSASATLHRDPQTIHPNCGWIPSRNMRSSSCTGTAQLHI